MDYRIKTEVSVVKFPKGFEEEKRYKCAPCSMCKQLKLAHETESEKYKNDVTGVFLKKGKPTDIIEFKIEKDGTELDNLGFDVSFPNDSLAVGFVFDWKQYLTAHGQGCYTIKASFTISGVEGGYTIGIYNLRRYSINTAKRTVRVHSVFRSADLFNEVDFTDSNFEDSVRFYGFFGNRQPKTEISNLIGVNRKIEKVTRENLNSYELKTDPIPVCISRQLIDLHFLHEDGMSVSDHNASNHSYLYLDTKVVLEESPQVEYFEGNRLAKINVILSDRTKKSKSFYNKK